MRRAAGAGDTVESNVTEGDLRHGAAGAEDREETALRRKNSADV